MIRRKFAEQGWVPFVRAGSPDTRSVVGLRMPNAARAASACRLRPECLDGRSSLKPEK